MMRSTSAATSGELRNYRHEILGIARRLALADPRDFQKRLTAERLPACDLGQGRVVEDHIGRHVLRLRQRPAPRPQRLPEILVEILGTRRRTQLTFPSLAAV